MKFQELLKIMLKLEICQSIYFQFEKKQTLKLTEIQAPASEQNSEKCFYCRIGRMQNVDSSAKFVELIFCDFLALFSSLQLYPLSGKWSLKFDFSREPDSQRSIDRDLAIVQNNVGPTPAQVVRGKLVLGHWSWRRQTPHI